jgi:hypothetical protein
LIYASSTAEKGTGKGNEDKGDKEDKGDRGDKGDKGN